MSSAMPTARLAHEARRVFAICSLALAITTIFVACGRGGQPAQGGPGGPGGGMPPMPVDIVTLAAKPVEQTTEFVASMKSRRSATIQPQVEGFITRIEVRSGQNVSHGALLFEIDAAPEQAALASMQSMRPMRESDVEFAQQQVARNQTLYKAGAISQ